MSEIVFALAPTLSLIVVGQLLRRANVVPRDAWVNIEKLTYFFFFPTLLVRNIAVQDLEGIPWPGMLAVLSVTLVTASAVLVLWFVWRRPTDGATFTSVFQGGVRFNSYVALALSQSFFGTHGLRVGAAAVGLLIVVVNVLSVAALSTWGANAGNGTRPFFRDIVTNPLILACLLGWALSASGIGLPGLTEPVLDLISRAALPLGLLAVGAVLEPQALRGHARPIVWASLVQFGLKPVVALIALRTFGLSGVAAGVLFLAFITPVAPSAYILSRQLGGNSDVMASIITAQTLCAFAFMPVLAWLFMTGL